MNLGNHVTSLPPYATIPFEPLADPAAVVVFDAVRFTLLTPRVIRLEYDPDGRFEDRPSQTFWFRRQPVPKFNIGRDGSLLTITTDYLHLAYRSGGPGFDRENLSITLLPNGPNWYYGDIDTGNLLGTTRTLDKVSGRTQLEPGLLSRAGWTVIDDSRTLVFNQTGWLEPREAGDKARDLYFFGYGHAYRDCLRDFCRIAGSTPLLPRWALGNWWSRYWAYSDEELRRLMNEFRAHEIPLAVCILDMDWHLVDVGEGVSGWTGYTWNNDLFPDPPAFIEWLHTQGLKTALNLHPALGIRPYEAMYTEIASRLGLKPSSAETIPFDIADPGFTEGYFELLHHPQEEIGVDFWWMDWQQGTYCGLEGLDPLWWINHLHFYDLGRQEKRPFIFSRWGGLGNHRYPIGFSGDTVVSWETLAFQPYFTATAANVGYGWWSHDIGGHMEGIEDPELYTRWVQFGVFSPIFRLHSTKNPFHERRPWGYDAEVLRLTREAMQLRHALIPYIYTMSRLDETQNQALVRPMYHDYPDFEEAYVCPQQYMFGTDLIVAPYTTPADPDTRLSRQAFWLPLGDWYHFFTGELFPGEAWYTRYGSLDDIPVFARAGAIVPLGPRVGWGGIESPEELDLHVFTGADSRFTLYEDDGESKRYLHGAHSLTTVTQRWEPGPDGRQLKLTIAPVAGDTTALPDRRIFRIHLYGVASSHQITVRVNGQPQTVDYEIDEEHSITHIAGLSPHKTAGLQMVVTLNHDASLRADPTGNHILVMLSRFRLNTLAKAWIAARLPELLEDPTILADFVVELTPSQTRALLEVTQGVGVHDISEMADTRMVVLWNNRHVDTFSRHFAETNRGKWAARDRYQSLRGTVPRFEVIRPKGKRWRLAVDYLGLMTHHLGSKDAGSD
jgi:alpha-glucosidase (family GH31 glycosyl hydrolase)